MRKILLLVTVVLVSFGLKAQVLNPVTWTAVSKKTKNNTYEIHLTANLQKGWHIYSQSTPDGGPVATSISFAVNPLIILDNKWKEVGNMQQHHEDIFGVDVKQYSDKVEFVQTVKLKAAVKTAAAVSVEYMVCNDKQCLPPVTKKFSVALN